MSEFTFERFPVIGIFFDNQPDDVPDKDKPGRPTNQPADNGVKSKDMNMRLMTCNVKNTPDLPRPAVVSAGRTVSGKAGIICCQEIVEREDHLDMRKGLGPEYDELFGGNRNPIYFIKDAWKVSNADSVLMHNGLANTSGPRYANYATFQSKSRPDLKPFIVMNTHMVSGAWNAKFNSNDGWRRDKWEHHFDKMGKLIARLTADGMDVFLCGDMNRGSVVPMKKFLNKERQFIKGGIDKISFFPGANSPLRVTQIGSLGKINTTSDHDAKVIKFKLTEVKGK